MSSRHFPLTLLGDFLKTSPKSLGTRQETTVVNQALDAGLIAERLAEGGAKDLGDVRISTDTDWIGEVKHRERLNIHRELDKALAKSGTPDTFVVWRRSVRKKGNVNRTQDGPVVVALTLDRFLELLKETV